MRLNPACRSAETIRNRLEPSDTRKSTARPVSCALSPTPPACWFCSGVRLPEVIVKGTPATCRAESSFDINSLSSPTTSSSLKYRQVFTLPPVHENSLDHPTCQSRESHIRDKRYAKSLIPMLAPSCKPSSYSSNTLCICVGFPMTPDETPFSPIPCAVHRFDHPFVRVVHLVYGVPHLQ